MKKIILAGGSGFLGQALAEYFAQCGHEVVVLTRKQRPAPGTAREVAWDGRSLGGWVRELEGAMAVINLAGRSVNCRYTQLNRRRILESRVQSTWALGAAIAQCKNPPRVWLNSSTATIYKHTFGSAWDETGGVGATPEAHDEFSIKVATVWEEALRDARTPATRKIALRSAMVLGNRPNSVFPVLQRLTQYGLGGKMAGGRQYVSWIHETDFCRAIEWLIIHEEFNGVVNVCAPYPVTNARMMELFREAGHRPFGLPAARWMLEIGAFFLRTETELILKSRHVVPKRLLNSGFEFQFRELREALEALQQARERGTK